MDVPGDPEDIGGRRKLMKSSMIAAAKCAVLLFLSLLVSLILGGITSRLTGAPAQDPAAMPSLFMGMLTVGIIQTLITALTASRLNLDRIRLALVLAALLFGINHLLNIMESLVYMQKVYPAGEQLIQLVSGGAESLARGFLAAWLFGVPVPEAPKFRFSPSRRLALSWAGWTLVWFAVYITAGMLIPMAVPGVSEYYFGENGAMDRSLVAVGYLLQIPRAALWILMAIPLAVFLKGDWWEKGLLAGVVFGGLMSSSLLIPNDLMPAVVRMAHLPEILFANLFWGTVLVRGLRRYVREIPS